MENVVIYVGMLKCQLVKTKQKHHEASPSNKKNGLCLLDLCNNWIYVVVYFFMAINFYFSFVSTSLASLPYPKTKEKQKFPEIKINYNISKQNT